MDIADTLPPATEPRRDIVPPCSPAGPSSGRTGGEPPRLVAVVGACGGAGSSLLAATLTRSLRRRSRAATLIDLDLPGAGLDVLLGIEAAAGARWPDLADARGSVDGADLLAALPRWGTVPVLSGTRAVPAVPDVAVVLDVTTALLRVGECVVLDLPRPGGWGDVGRSLVSAADTVLLVAPLTAPGAAGAVAVDGVLTAAGVRDVRLVARGPAPGRVDATGLAAALGRDVDAVVGWDARLAGAVERGEGPPARRRSPLWRAAVSIAEGLDAPATRGAGTGALRGAVGASA
jgi:secretion/DNA translocation related CpaE-like protein